MKTDKLEKFILENRESFDDLEPRKDLFDGVAPRKTKGKRFDLKIIFTRVAAVLVIFVVSYYFHDFMQKRGSGNSSVATSNVGKNGQSKLYLQLQEASFYYTSQIEDTKTMVFKLTGNNADLRQEINSELMDLDKVFQQLKSDLNDNVDNEEVIVAMIQNYRLKLEILKDILKQLKATDEKNNKHEAKQISI